MLAEKLSELKHQLIDYAILVEGMIDKSIKGLRDKNPALFKEVVEQNEPIANDFDRKIEEMCTHLIAQYEPMASDLRTTLMILKMNKDLERMADHAVNICESGVFLIEQSELPAINDLFIMAENAVSMLKDSIKTFVNADVALANEVCERDSIVDRIGDKILNELTPLMRIKKDSIKASLHIMRIAHNLERVADLSTNVCEDVIYMVQGKDIKHHHLDGNGTEGNG